MRIPSRKMVKRAASLLLLVLAMCTFVTSSTQNEALADNGIMSRLCPVDSSPEITVVDNGGDGMFVPPYVDETTWEDPTSFNRIPNDATVYGQYGSAGLHWHTVQDHCLDKITTFFQRTLGNTLLGWSQDIAHTGIVVYSYAMSDGLLNRISFIFSEIMTSMRDNIFLPYLTPMVILGSAWMAWQGLVRKRFTLTVEAAGWMIFVTVFTLWILASPLTLMQGASTFVQGASSAVNTSINYALSDRMGSGIQGCPIGMYDEGELADETSGNIPSGEKGDWESWNNYYVRMNTDHMYQHLMCDPWTAGYFGRSTYGDMAAMDYGAQVLRSQAVSRIEAEAWNDRSGDDYWDGTNYFEEEIKPVKNEQFEEVRAELERGWPMVYPMFSGEWAGDRASIAGMALMGNILVTSVVFVVSIALIVVKFAFLVSLLIFPFVGLLSVFPGLGKTLFFQWLEITLGLLLKQIVLSMIVSLYIGLSSEVMRGADFGGGILILFCFLLVLLVYRRHFSNLFTAATSDTAGRIASHAKERHELKAASNALPPVAYWNAQRWGWRNKYKIAAASAGVGSWASTGARSPSDAPSAVGPYEKASREMDRVTGETTDDPGRGPRSWARRHMEGHTRPASAAPDRPTSAPEKAGSTAPERSGGHTPASAPVPDRPASAPEDAAPLGVPGRRKGMLGGGSPRRVDAPTRGGAAPDLDLSRSPARTGGFFGGRSSSSEAPALRPTLRESWRPPNALKGAVPWSVTPRKKGLPRKLFPFGGGKGD